MTHQYLEPKITELEKRIEVLEQGPKTADKPIEKGIDLVPVGRLETQDEYLLDILKEQGFYLMHKKRETAYTELEYYEILYPKED